MGTYNINKLYIELTYNCNLNCKHCYNNSGNFRNEEMTEDILQKLLYRINENGKINRIILSGGEVTLYPYLEDILDFFRKKNIAFTIITNGINFPQRIIKYFTPQDQVQISLEGPSPVENDYIRGHTSYDRATQTAATLINNSINTYFRYSITALNYTKVEEMILLALKYNMPLVQFSNLFPYGRGALNTEIYPNESQIIQSMILLHECKQKHKNNIFVDVPDQIFGGCSFVIKQSEININPRVDINGNLFLCQMFNRNELTSGNIRDASILELLNSLRTKNILNLIAAINNTKADCDNCYAHTICNYGCPAINLSNNQIWGTDGVCLCRKHLLNKYLLNR